MKHLLVTNDFPPKVGGIQSYLWELWRRLPAGTTSVLTAAHPDAGEFDAAQTFPILRSRRPVLLPTPSVRREVLDLADRSGAELIVLDPVLPLGLIGPGLGWPYAVIAHGAEVAIPGHTPGLRPLLARVLSRADGVVAGGGYPADEAEGAARRGLPVSLVPPGVDIGRFRPLDEGERAEARRRLGVDPDVLLVASISRLVPRKGMDVLIRAAARVRSGQPNLQVVIGGGGRDRSRLERLIRTTRAPVRLVGRIEEGDLPSFYGCADVFAMLCRTRWGGLEQEGFGIVFLEAAASGVPQIAGRSGGSAEAVAHGDTGLVVQDPGSVEQVAAALDELLGDPDRRLAMGIAARKRAEEEFSYDLLARRLDQALERWVARP